MVSRNKSVPRHRWDVPTGRSVPWWQKLTPPQLFIGSFALMIAMGTVGLWTVPSFYVQGQPLSLYDAAFTSTSAVCVTGLTVVDTGTHFTFSGQLFLLVLIQLGGLGMLSLTSLIIIALGRRLSLRSESLTNVGGSNREFEIDVRTLTRDIVRFTVWIEVTGAVCLWAIWAPQVGMREAIWPAIFHSISAFCNAGFSTNSTSLIEHQNSPLTLLVIGGLVIAGGLGFLTLEECYTKYWSKRGQVRQRLSLHCRLVLATSLVLILLGFVVFLVLEWRGVLSHLSWWDRVNNALFMSITARTAGFNCIDYSEACDSTNFATMLLMMIGGSPGSTAGGLKTTTFAVIGLVAWARLCGHETTVLSNRSIREETIQRAIGLLAVSGGVIALGTMLLLFSESQSAIPNGFLKCSFEAVSAVNTVGLSLGVTPNLNSYSKLLLSCLMFFGRVGPLTLVAAFVVQRPTLKGFRFAYEDVDIG
ncbi:MAG: potassium transporter TrkH [Planctomycetaceae bacterium]|nr:potassium transporter TrkH [Planctomycetaceae bacterium]